MGSNQTKGRIFIDMDGVLAEWNNEASLEEIHRKGYFRNRPPVASMVDAVRRLILQNENIYILSACLTNDYALPEKVEWLAEHLRELPKDRQIFVPYGESKTDYIIDKLSTDILIDDYSENLKSWHGVGIKVLNGLNWTKGTWQGMVVDHRSSAEAIAQTIIGIRMASDLGIGMSRSSSLDIGGLGR